MKLIRDIENLLVAHEELTFRKAMEKIGQGGQQIALVIDGRKNLVGVITDGDVRSALLNGALMDDKASVAISSRPICTLENDANKAGLLALRFGINSVVFGAIGEPPKGLYVVNPASDFTFMPPALIMAGGKGLRLRPITEKIPKPLIEIDGVPIIHRVLKSLARSGVRKVFVSIHYLGYKIRESIDDGKKFNIDVEFVEESEPMGTAGAIALLPEKENFSDLIVMNADLLTEIDFSSLVQFHRLGKNDFTVAVREVENQIPYGVIQMENGIVSKVEEKPCYKHLINAGIYCISKESFPSSPNGPVDMPRIMNQLIEDGKRIGAYQIFENWIDIGTPDELSKANDLIKNGLF